MSALRSILSGVGDAFTPDGTLIRVNLRITLDMLVTLAITLLAIGLTIGYQLLGRRVSRDRREQP
jgi:hypothetical protein